MVRRPSTAATRRRRALATSRRERAASTSARQRILTTADRLFYGEGIQAVGVQRVVEEAEVTRVTFYRHFPSKDDLVLAYLAARAERAQAAVQRIIDAHAGDPRTALSVWAQAVVDDGVVDEYRGCTFVNAAAEYGDTEHPVRRAAIAQRTWVLDTTTRLLAELGHPAPERASRVLLALRTGFVFSSGLEDPADGAQIFLEEYERVVSEH